MGAYVIVLLIAMMNDLTLTLIMTYENKTRINFLIQYGFISNSKPMEYLLRRKGLFVFVILLFLCKIKSY